MFIQTLPGSRHLEVDSDFDEEEEEYFNTI